MASHSRNVVKLYDLRSRTIISTLTLDSPGSLAISPDSTRLAAASHGAVHLWDIASIKTSNPDSKKRSNRATALAFSPDCSRLAAGLADGTVELWNTDQVGQPVAAHKLHLKQVTTLVFSPDGEQLASGSGDKTVRVWDGRDGSRSRVIEHTYSGWLQSVALSSGLLATATKHDITIWDRETLSLINSIILSSLSLPFSDVFRARLSFLVDGSLLAIACEDNDSDVSNVTVWNMGRCTVLATFKVNSNIRKLTLSPDGSQVFAEIHNGGFQLFDVSTGNAIQQTGHDGFSWIPKFNGIPISCERRQRGNNLVGRFSERYERVPLLYFPTEVQVSSITVGPSMFAVGSEDGRILLVRS
jgi:WD40 repeat protein